MTDLNGHHVGGPSDPAPVVAESVWTAFADEEDAAMLLAVKAFKDGKKRKGGLLLNDKKLILPPGRH